VATEGWEHVAAYGFQVAFWNPVIAFLECGGPDAAFTSPVHGGGWEGVESTLLAKKWRLLRGTLSLQSTFLPVALGCAFFLLPFFRPEISLIAIDHAGLDGNGDLLSIQSTGIKRVVVYCVNFLKRTDK